MKQDFRPISEALRRAIKLAPVPSYKLAQTIGVHPSTLSAWRNGIYNPTAADPRVLLLAQLLGIAQSEAFARDEPSADEAHGAR